MYNKCRITESPLDKLDFGSFQGLHFLQYVYRGFVKVFRILHISTSGLGYDGVQNDITI